MDAELVLYNNVEYFVATPGLSFTETMVFAGNVQEDVKNRKKSLDKLATKLKSSFRIPVRTVVDETDIRVSDGIKRVSKKLPNSMIVMEAQTGPFMSVLVGSTTRQVVREAIVPVLVFYYRHKAK
jgi:nucleotide-binding universal stress UspA family protein